MPCNCDHMEPNAAERHRREAAQHLVYLFERLGKKIDPSIKAAADDLYGTGGDECVAALCEILGGHMEEVEAIVYDAKDRRSRRLADWWEDHQEEDREAGR